MGFSSLLAGLNLLCSLSLSASRLGEPEARTLVERFFLLSVSDMFQIVGSRASGGLAYDSTR